MYKRQEDKTKIKACTEQLKKSVESDDIEAIKSDIEALSQASHKMAEMLYSQQQETQESHDPGDESDQKPDGEEKSGKEDEDIVDADFEEVKK